MEGNQRPHFMDCNEGEASLHWIQSKVLSWNSRWRSWLVLFRSAANELAAQHTNTYLVLARALQKPSSFPSSTCIDMLRSDFMYIIQMLNVQKQYFSHAHSIMLWMYWQQQVSVLVLPQQCSRSIPPRPNTKTLSHTLPCQTLWELSRLQK